MEKKQHNQEPGQQQTQGEQNPTLNEKGSAVADYGNVMGGSSDQNVQEGNQSGEQERSGSNDTLGNP